MHKGFKHLIKCRCILPQFKSRPDAPAHQFVVFSVLDDDSDSLSVHFAQCPNCGIVHKVTDVCKSEIMAGKELLSSILTLDELKSSLPGQLVAILETHYADRATFEHAKWILENQAWGDFVVISSDVIDGMKQGKYVRIISDKMFKIDNFVRDEVISF